MELIGGGSVINGATPSSFTFYTQFSCERGQTQDLHSQKPPWGIMKVCPSWRLQGMCCGMFCIDGEVVFIHSKLVNKIRSNTLILVVTCG